MESENERVTPVSIGLSFCLDQNDMLKEVVYYTLLICIGRARAQGKRPSD